MIQLTIRSRLLSIVGSAAISFLVLMIASTLVSQQVEEKLIHLESQQIPRLEIGPQLASDFNLLRRGYQDAVAANDVEVLDRTREVYERITTRTTAARTILDPGAVSAFLRALREYHETAYDVSRRMISGEGGEKLVEAISKMQSKQTQTHDLLEKLIAVDEQGMKSTFRDARAALAEGTRRHLMIGGASFIIVLLLSFWLIRHMVQSLAGLERGLTRFGKGGFDEAIEVVGSDELAGVATNANRMASDLARAADDRERSDWIKSALVELSTDLRGELEQDDVALRAARNLARSLGAPAAALYVIDPDAPAPASLTLMGSYGMTTGEAPTSVPVGSGLIGEAACATDVVVIEELPQNFLRLQSALGESTPKTLVLAPLLHNDGPVSGVLELALFKPFDQSARELINAARETIAVALEVARSRSAMSLLLVQLKDQATRLLAQDEELRRANDQLEQKANQLEGAIQELDAFNYSVSHDLRAPLRPLAGFSQILLEEHGDKLDDEGKDLLKRIGAAANRMGRLIDDLLRLSSVKGAKMVPRPVDLTAIAQAIVADLRSGEPERKVEIVTSPISVVADGNLLRIALENLLRNAWKFTSKTANARIEIGSRETNGELAYFIADNGAGFDPARAGKLFAAFQRLHTNDEFAGSGIGLAIVRRIINHHGGRIWADSQPNRGATFSFTLPAR